MKLAYSTILRSLLIFLYYRLNKSGLYTMIYQFCPYVVFVLQYLVGGLEHVLFFHILGIIIPTDSYFSEG